MSLKAFHVFFVVVSTVFALGFGAWAVSNWLRTGSGLSLAILSFAAAAALVWYGLWFLRKLKGVSYL